MRNILLIFLFVTSCSLLRSQNSTDSVYIRLQKSKMEFIQNGKILDSKEIDFILNSKSGSEQEYGKAKTNLYTSSAFAFVGGGLIGYTFGKTFAGGGDLNYILLGSGTVCILIAVLFQNSYKEHAKSAVKIYNQQLNSKSRSSLHFGLTSRGIGLSLLLK